MINILSSIHTSLNNADIVDLIFPLKKWWHHSDRKVLKMRFE